MYYFFIPFFPFICLELHTLYSFKDTLEITPAVIHLFKSKVHQNIYRLRLYDFKAVKMCYI